MILSMQIDHHSEFFSSSLEAASSKMVLEMEAGSMRKNPSFSCS